ncbi:fungal-specific transcription factor domain-containing protein [Mycena maculata]|uniref:Fungal-specific transcription factor domain-containing protein n=1 Tax=Mycena maculata TaxID=230809 RepID=A0AAD7IW11_9AGAR|nr:fungal-specific transcription factor domain-containing protein [Mycena maculata]
MSSKKRRVQRACNECRRNKSVCDGPRMSETKCTNCIENGLECTFAGAIANRRTYVDVLEARVELTEKLLRVEHLLRKLSPTAVPSPASRSQWSSDSPILRHRSPAAAGPPAPGPGVELAALTIRSMNDPAPAPHGDDLAHIELAREMQDLSVKQHRENFIGKSSTANLVKSAVLLRQGYEEKEDLPWTSRRMHFWTYNPAINETPHCGPFIFPAPDLLSDLTTLYFAHSNVYYPVLHRPTLEKSIADGLHTRDQSFGAVVLLMCAIASRYSEDPRVLAPGEEPMRCGWKYFDQIPNTVHHLFNRPTLSHLQYYCLATLFLEPSTPASCWTLIGLGIRLAQDVGAHRAGFRASKPTVDSELWKRGFWVLVCMDRKISAEHGRPCSSQYEDIDVELPIECDDEFWEPEDPACAFQQPAGRPSQVAYFAHYIRLNNIFAFSLKMLYSLNKAKELLAVRDDLWEEHIVAELDSALNAWVDSIPTHLTWDPTRPDGVFFDQSASLYCFYYQVQMTIHRPFIPMIRTNATTALPSLAIVTNAARSASHICDISTRHKNETPLPFLLSAAFTSGIVLLLNVWNGKRTGLPPEMNTAITEVHKCMACIRVCEKRCVSFLHLQLITAYPLNRWQIAGLYWDMLYELAVIGQLPLPMPAPPVPSLGTPGSRSSNSHKRGREDDGAEDHPVFAARVHYPPYQDTYSASSVAWDLPVEHTPQLPTYTAELGRLPVYNQHTPLAESSSSSWYPQQTSAAPLGYPDFTPGAGFDTGAESMSMFTADGLEGGEYVVEGVEFAGIGDGLSSDAMAMWVNAPTGFGIDHWGTYLSVMNEANQALAAGTAVHRVDP